MVNILVIMTHRRVINTAGGQRFTCSLVQGDLIGTSQSDFLFLEPRTKVKEKKAPLMAKIEMNFKWTLINILTIMTEMTQSPIQSKMCMSMHFVNS